MIFVHVASYRDPECEPTVRDLLAKAKYPNDLRVVIVLQSEVEDAAEFQADNVRIVPVVASESKGACWARNLGYHYFDGEDYVLQIDSHMRFTEHWDAKLLDQLARCGVNKPLLTTYAPPYVPENPVLGKNPCFLHAEKFGHDGRLSQGGSIYEIAPAKPPKMTALLSAHMLFAPSEWIGEVPYDPYLYFTGEEPTLAVRSWTHGWDMFGPSEAIIWHRYGREDRVKHWDDHLLWYRSDALALKRYRHLLQMDYQCDDPEALVELTRYGCGTTRSLADYQTFSGINFKAQTLTEFAIAGNWKL